MIFCRIPYLHPVLNRVHGHAGLYRQLLSNPIAQWHSLASWGHAILLPENLLVPAMHLGHPGHAWCHGQRVGCPGSLLCPDGPDLQFSLDCHLPPGQLDLPQDSGEIGLRIFFALVKVVFLQTHNILSNKMTELYFCNVIELHIGHSQFHPFLFLTANDFSAIYFYCDLYGKNRNKWIKIHLHLFLYKVNKYEKRIFRFDAKSLLQNENKAAKVNSCFFNQDCWWNWRQFYAKENKKGLKVSFRFHSKISFLGVCYNIKVSIITKHFQ